MDHTGACQGLSPGGRSSSPASSVPRVSKGQGAQPSPRSRLTVTPFHNSSIVMNDAALQSKRLGSVPTVDHHTSEGETDFPLPTSTTTAGSVENSSSSLTQTEARPVGKHVGNKAPKSDETGTLTSGPPSNSEPAHNQDDDNRNRVYSSVKAQTAVKKKKRKMGMYNLVPKRKTKTVKQEKKEEANAGMGTSQAAEGPSTVQPKTEKAVEQAGSREELLVEGVESVEYTEVALDFLDLKAQEELLSPPHSGMAGDAEGEEADMAEELPLCCCRMETPNSGGSLSTLGPVCMATDSSDGMLRYCQRPVIKQELMRPSNMVQLLLLCEDHRAGMVKHQCCPGCGVFCRVGSFMECRPYGSISHRFHRECAFILKDRIFCPHCGEDASGATKVTVSKPDPSPSVPRSNPGPALPVVATLPSVPTTPAVPQVLRAKKSSEPRRNRDLSLSRPKGEGAHFADRHPKESLESILVSLDDENLKVKKVKFPARQLYVSAKQGDLTRVIQLLVDGKDPNLLMEGQNKRTPLHAASAEGHQEICHMLVQAGANLDMFDDEHRTPLMAACEHNQLDTVCYLLRAGAAIGHKDLRGFTCLHLAAKLGHYDIIGHLLTKASKHINCQDDGGWTPITWAIEHKHIEVVRLLLNKGADVNIKDKEENICLHWAALSGCDDIVQALLESLCDLNAVNIHGDTPLHIAARENHLECVMLFLSRGADVTKRNKEADTALDLSTCGSKVWTALNTNKKLTEARRGRDCQGERLLSRDISRGYEAVSITCVNGVDSEPCPDNFKYIPDSCVTSPLNIDKDITHLQHCSCTDDCSSSTCMCGQLSLRCWYDSEGRLPLDFCHWEPPVLFECNHACSCWRTCRNRVVQNGLRVRLQLFRTEKIGWGVRATHDIPQGTFICEYIGEIITDSEADKRENDSFLFTLDNKVGEVHCIDARLFGNIGRFINHLCEPNLMAVRVFTMHQDLRFPRIAFFSSRPIKAGDQIGIDYGDGYWRVKTKCFSCQCGSVKCRYSAANT